MKNNIIELKYFPIFNNIPRAVVLDLDGTLLDSRLQISERNRKAVQSCVAQGMAVIIATSRAERSVLRWVGAQFLSCCSLVFLNGAIGRGISPLSGSIDKPISPELAAKVIKRISDFEPEARITVEINGIEFGQNRKPDAAALWEINSASPDMLLPLERAVQLYPRKIAVGGLNRKLFSLIRILSSEFRGEIEVIPANDYTFLNVVRAGVSKMTALEKLFSKQGITLNEVLAFGDDYPDLEMLVECGYSVAMGNAVPEVKAAARYRTLSNDEDGVAVILETIPGL